MADAWLDNLKRMVQKKPLVVFQFEGEEWARLQESRRGANEFTIARSHELFEKVKVPTACLVIGKDGDGSAVYFGLASSRTAVATLESRIKVKRALLICPIPDDQICPRRWALFMARSVLRGIRDGGQAC